jgi:cytidylate kinase
MDKLFNYFDDRYRESILHKPPVDDGPVITLSRLTGCDARPIAEKLVNDLNLAYGFKKWRWVDKEIIYTIAKELNTDSQRVENFYRGNELCNISDMIMAFSGGFVSDLRVKKAIRDIVLSMCKEGYIILVGRGGVSIARDIRNSLHIRLIAPFYWRVENIMRKRAMGIEAAEEFIIESDKNRFSLIQAFLDKKSIVMDNLFDATINRNSFTIEATSDLILSMYNKKLSGPKIERRW